MHCVGIVFSRSLIISFVHPPARTVVATKKKPRPPHGERGGCGCRGLAARRPARRRLFLGRTPARIIPLGWLALLDSVWIETTRAVIRWIGLLLVMAHLSLPLNTIRFPICRNRSNQCRRVVPRMVEQGRGVRALGGLRFFHSWNWANIQISRR